MGLTADRLRELCQYDPETGVMTWKVKRGLSNIGSPVGGSHRSHGYCQTTVDCQKYQVHRLVWFYVYGEWPKGEIDHIKGVREDNRLCNLRDVPQAINRQNTRAPTSRKKQGLLGAHLRRNGKWQAAICLNYKQIHLGMFDTADEAHAVYLEAKRKIHEGCAI